MERVNKIINHGLFQAYLEKNRIAEENRRFCRHDMGHFLDVARLAMIFYLQNGCLSAGGSVNGDSKEAEEELIYAAAFLHDIGRWKQYECDTPHEKASALLAPEILLDCGFREKETAQIIDAIVNHRNEAVKEEKSLRGLLYRADKMSRSCFCCEAEGECDWKGSKKNPQLRY